MVESNEVQRMQSEISSLNKVIKTGLKIRDLQNAAPINEALLYAFNLVGLDEKNYPTKIDKQILVDFVIGAYGGLIAEEIKTAFKMAVSKKFPDLDVACYQKFSCEYFGRVMASYYIWRGNVLKQQFSGERNLPEAKISDLDYYERRLFQPYDLYCETNKYTIDDLNAHIIYDDLFKWGLITFSKEEKAIFGAEARLITPKKKREKPTEPEESKEDHDRRIVKVAKALTLKAWIEEQSFNETNLREIITVLIRK